MRDYGIGDIIIARNIEWRTIIYLFSNIEFGSSHIIFVRPIDRFYKPSEFRIKTNRHLYKFAS